MMGTRVEKALFLGMLLGALLACKNFTKSGDDDDNKKADESSESSGDTIGVKECDDYISKFEKCINSSTEIPTEAKKAQLDAFKKTREAWKQAAKTPGGKAGLKMGCEQAMNAAKESMKAYNCEW